MFKKNKNGSAKVDNGLKLNYKRTFIIGFAFFGILLLWQVYDSWTPTFLTELFKEAFNLQDEHEVQYLVGIMMAIDNLAALIMLPIFGHLSDKTHTKIGKRMPYILIGTFCCAVAFPFLPVAFHYHSLAGTIIVMAIVVFFAMMYRNPAVALMPDITPKPLRSKANGIINIMGYIGGACATILGIAFVLTSYINGGWATGTANIWLIEAPFLIASVLMIGSALFLFFSIDENAIEIEMAADMQLGEKLAEVKDTDDDHKPMTKQNKIMLILILSAEFLWFMADNGVATFMTNYSLYHLHTESASPMINVIIGGVGSMLGFLVGGYIASYIGRKWTIFGGLSLTVLAYIIWASVSLSTTVPIPPEKEFNPFPIYIYIVWFIKGFGMSLVHANSFPMVVELCGKEKVGKFTGYYYASSMASQTITPVLVGSFMLIPALNGFSMLPVYALICSIGAFIVFAFVKMDKNKTTHIKKGLESLDVDD